MLLFHWHHQYNFTIWGNSYIRRWKLKTSFLFILGTYWKKFFSRKHQTIIYTPDFFKPYSLPFCIHQSLIIISLPLLSPRQNPLPYTERLTLKQASEFQWISWLCPFQSETFTKKTCKGSSWLTFVLLTGDFDDNLESRHPKRGILLVSHFWLLWIKRLWTFLYIYFYEYIHSFLLDR